jgi:hypothetical protein
MRRAARTLALIVFYAMAGVTALSAQNGDPVAEAKRLRDAGQYAAAANALSPYLAQHPDDAGTHWFRAQLLYWAGDRRGARGEYELALRNTPTDAAAADSLKRYIADLADNWVSAGVSAQSDDQPLRSTSVGLQVGRYVSSNAAMFVDAGAAGYTAPESASGNASTVTTAQVGARITAHRLSVGGAAGAERSSTGATTGIGNAWAALGMPGLVNVTAALSRAGYHYTVPSIDTTVVVTAIEAGIERNPDAKVERSSIAGRLALRREWYDDDNAIGIVYGWVLAPVAGGLRLGYAADFRDARESRWSGAEFDPYYTPENVRVHSVIGDWSWNDFRRAIRLSGALGVRAHELAPYLLNPSGKQFGFTERSFSPWSAAASGTWRINWNTSLRAEVRHSSTAFYEATTAQLGTTLLIK